MLMFIRVEMNCYILNLGKFIVDKDYYMVLISLLKVKWFLDDEYFEEI